MCKIFAKADAFTSTSLVGIAVNYCIWILSSVIYINTYTEHHRVFTNVSWNLSNGQPVYNFCVTVDDATMRISHVIR